MKQKLIKDNLIRFNIKKNESKKISLKILMRLKYLNYLEIFNNLSRTNKNKSVTKVHNQCFITARRHGINTKTGISRIKLRELTKNGVIMGMKKLCW